MREPHYWKGTLEICGLPLWAIVNLDDQIVEEVVLDLEKPIDIHRFASEYGPWNTVTTLEDQILSHAQNKAHDGLPIGEP